MLIYLRYEKYGINNIIIKGLNIGFISNPNISPNHLQVEPWYYLSDGCKITLLP